MIRGPWEGLALIAVATVAFGTGGGLVGLLLGLAVPGYYVAVFDGPVDPVPTGIGLGVTQGLGAGVLVGAFLVVWFTLRPGKLRTLERDI
ncbi:MAG: hypothetical protein JST30_03945 [Armatimonadetes bacterium]|nr:hypothetical protein [Armatimonadota bacterium]